MARPRCADGDGLKIWRVAANILLKKVISDRQQGLVLILMGSVGREGGPATPQGKI